jgi:hypothetical protein
VSIGVQTTSVFPPQFSHRKKILLGALAVIISGCAALLAFQDNDFLTFYNAGLAARLGMNPYTGHGPFFPASALFYFSVISLLPEPIAFRVTIFISTLVYCAVLYQFSGHNLINTAIGLASPILLYNVFYTNIEWIVFLATIVNPLIGFLLAMTKPQIGGVLAVVLLIVIYRRYGFKVAVGMCIVQLLILLGSFAWGLTWGIAVPVWGNFNLFPWGLLLGIPLAGFAIFKCDYAAALAASPLLSPYVTPQSWVAVLPLLVRRRWVVAITVVAMWLLVALAVRG